MIRLKNLARDFELDPYALRMALRAANLQPMVNKRWKWSDVSEPEYVKAREVAQALSVRLRSTSRITSGSGGK